MMTAPELLATWQPGPDETLDRRLDNVYRDVWALLGAGHYGVVDTAIFCADPSVLEPTITCAVLTATHHEREKFSHRAAFLALARQAHPEDGLWVGFD